MCSTAVKSRANQTREWFSAIDQAYWHQPSGSVGECEVRLQTVKFIYLPGISISIFLSLTSMPTLFGQHLAFKAIDIVALMSV